MSNTYGITSKHPTGRNHTLEQNDHNWFTSRACEAVLEVVEDEDGSTYRAIYTVRLGNAVYVLHCFQKKSHKGIETAKQDIDLIRDRLKFAQKPSEGVKEWAKLNGAVAMCMLILACQMPRKYL
jgi:hypothetical protein